ncbi:MAG: alpha/beta hydrolase-fold protein [Verrucomicrobiota bacterium]
MNDCGNHLSETKVTGAGNDALCLASWPRHQVKLASLVLVTAVAAAWLVSAGHHRPLETQSASHLELPWIKPAIEAPNSCRHVFFSPAARTNVSYLLYLPPDYVRDDSRRYPVLYWLHGTGYGLIGVPEFVQHLDQAIRDGRAPAMIGVFVNGLTHSRYLDSKDGQAPVESMFIHDLIPHIDGAYRTLAYREGRIIEGFSMGGEGAARLGLKYPEIFGAISVVAGAFPNLENVLKFQGSVFHEVYGDDFYYLLENNPRHFAEINSYQISGHTVMRIVVGTADNLCRINHAFHIRLQHLGIDNDFEELDGVAHDHTAIYAALGEKNWDFYWEAVKQGQPLPEPMTARDVDDEGDGL